MMKRKKTIILLILAIPPVAFLIFILWNVNYLSNAGPKAEAVMCRSRLKQVALGLEMYMDEFAVPTESVVTLFEWADLDPTYVRCPHIPREEPTGYVVKLDFLESGGEADDIIAFCPKVHPTHGENMHRFVYIDAQRSIMTRDLSTHIISEADFQKRLGAQKERVNHNKSGLEQPVAPATSP